MPIVSAAYAAILAILIALLSLNVSRVRASVDIWFDDGGNDRLARARRAHFTMVEICPTFLLVLLAYELLGGGRTWLIWLGVVFVVGRLVHVYGMFFLQPKNLPRGIGGTLSLLATAVTAVLILIKVWG